MADYTGETRRIRFHADDFDDASITNEDVIAAYVTIYDSDWEVIAAEAVATWDPLLEFDIPDGTGGTVTVTGGWYRLYTPPAAGTYRYKARVVGATFDTWEYGTFKAKADLAA